MGLPGGNSRFDYEPVLTPAIAPQAPPTTVIERGPCLVCPFRLLLLRMRDHDRGVQVHRDQAPVPAGRGVPGQRPRPLPPLGTAPATK